MPPSIPASTAAIKVGDDDNVKAGEVGHSQSLSNGSMPSLLMEGLVSPVDEEDIIITDNNEEGDDCDSDTRQQRREAEPNTVMGIPSINSSSDWEIEGRADIEDDDSPPSSTARPSTKQTGQWLTNECTNECTNDDNSISNDTATSYRSSQINYDACTTPTPPSRPYTPTGYETPLSYYNRSGTDDKSWLDPFPTPDISLHSRQNYHASIHTRSNHQGRIIGIADERINNTKKETRQTNGEWDEIIKKLPKLPTYDEFEVQDEASNKKKMINKSCPDLETLENNILNFRQVSSETSLLPKIKRNSTLNTLLKRPSMDDVWAALRAGPDGNGFDNEIGKQKSDEWDESILRRNSSGDNYRRDSSLYELVERDGKKKSVIGKTQSVPLDSNDGRFHEWEGIRRRNASNLKTSVQSNKTTPIDRIGSNAATLTNVTGAGLAKEVKLLRQRGTMTPGRFRSFLASPTVTRVRTSAQQRVIRPVRSAIVKQRTSAVILVRNTRQKLAERKERRRQRRLARLREPVPSWWIVIPADHPYKVAWDVLTMLWSLLGAYRTHIRIRDRVFDQSPLIMLTEIWFLLDIMLNFVTEHKTRNGEVIKDGKTVWARYLTTWFLIDVLSLIPWERIYVRPIVEKIKRRNFFQKTFFRSRAVVRVSRVLRGRHVKLFGRVSKHTGTPLRRMVTLIIQYVPKYLVFLRNMKGALMVRSLRLVHWLHNIYKKIWVKAKSGIYFRRRSTIRNTGHSIDESEESQGGDDSDSDQDDESESGNDGIGDDERMHFHGLQRPYSAPSTPIQRRRCFSHAEVSHL